jgi:copper chaperone CopZ
MSDLCDRSLPAKGRIQHDREQNEMLRSSHSWENLSRASHPVGAIEETFRTSGMDCSEEVAAIGRALKPIGGVLEFVQTSSPHPSLVYHDGSARSAKLIERSAEVCCRVKMDETPSSGGNASLASSRWNVRFVTGIRHRALQWLGLKETLWPEVAFHRRHCCRGTPVFPKALRSLKTFRLDMNV